MEQYKKFTKNVVWMWITNALVSLQGFILLPLLSKFLGAYDYGIWSQIKTTVILLSLISLLALDMAIIRFLSGISDKKRIASEYSLILLTCFISGLFFSFIMYIFSNSFALYLFKNINAAIYFKFAAILVLFFTLNALNLAFFRIFEQIKRYASICLLQAIGEVAIICILLIKGFGVFGIISAYLIMQFIVVTIEFAYIFKEFGVAKPAFNKIKPYFKFSMPLFFIPLFHWALQTGNFYIIGFYEGAKAVGIYSLAYSISYIIRTITEPLFFILQPALAEAKNKKNVGEFNVYLNYSYKYLMMISIPAALGLSILSKELLLIFSTEEFISGAQLIPYLMFGFVLFPIYVILNYIFQILKKTKFNLYLVAFFTMVNFTLNIILIPLIGLKGAAISVFITFLLLALISIYFIRKKSHLNFVPFFVAKCIVASLIMGLFILLIKSYLVGVFGLILIMGFSALIYFIILMLLKGFEKKEFEFFISFLK